MAFITLFILIFCFLLSQTALLKMGNWQVRICGKLYCGAVIAADRTRLIVKKGAA